MKRALILIALIAVAAHAAVQTPSQFLGFEVGADKNLADYKQIVSYFRALAAASPRVQVQDLGKTTLGEDFIMAVISSEANMRNLPRIKAIAKQLADPRGLLGCADRCTRARREIGHPGHLQHPLERDRVESDGDRVGVHARDRD